MARGNIAQFRGGGAEEDAATKGHAPAGIDISWQTDIGTSGGTISAGFPASRRGNGAARSQIGFRSGMFQQCRLVTLIAQVGDGNVPTLALAMSFDYLESATD